MKVHILIPWLATQSEREPELVPLILGLIAQAQISPSVHDVVVHLHVNGTDEGHTLAAIASKLPSGAPLYLTRSHVSNKMIAVHHGASMAQEACADALVVVDNDVTVPPGGLDALLTTFRHSETQVATAMKAPLLVPHSSAFQVLYSYAVTQSFRYSLFPKRPTGSFYAIDPVIALTLFPNELIDGLECAEGDLLGRAGAAMSGVIVRSPYARTFDLEVSRRRRHRTAAEHLGVNRLHADPDFPAEAMRVRLPLSVDRSMFMRSIALWSQVHTEAATSLDV